MHCQLLYLLTHDSKAIRQGQLWIDMEVVSYLGYLAYTCSILLHHIRLQSSWWNLTCQPAFLLASLSGGCSTHQTASPCDTAKWPHSRWKCVSLYWSLHGVIFFSFFSFSFLFFSFVPTCQRAGLHNSEVRLAAVVLRVCVCPHSCWFQWCRACASEAITRRTKWEAAWRFGAGPLAGACCIDLP